MPRYGPRLLRWSPAVLREREEYLPPRYAKGRHRLAHARPNIRLSLRSAFCICAPLIVGVMIHQTLDSIFVAIGALWAVSQDGLDDWRVRGRRILGVAMGGGVGLLSGRPSLSEATPRGRRALLRTGGRRRGCGGVVRGGRPKGPTCCLDRSWGRDWVSPVPCGVLLCACWAER